MRLDHRTPGRQKCAATCQARSGSGMQRYQLSGAHRTPHARSGQARCQNRKPHLSGARHTKSKNKKDKERKEKCEITFPSLEARGDARWSPPPGSARSTHVRCRRIRLQLLPSSAEADAEENGDVDTRRSTSYINIALCSRVTPFGRRGLSAPSSRFFDGSATSFRRLCRPVL